MNMNRSYSLKEKPLRELQPPNSKWVGWMGCSASDLYKNQNSLCRACFFLSLLVLGLKLIAILCSVCVCVFPMGFLQSIMFSPTVQRYTDEIDWLF